jgi:UDP-N-acetylenolpyruvoylglucosamine reductase
MKTISKMAIVKTMALTITITAVILGVTGCDKCPIPVRIVAVGTNRVVSCNGTNYIVLPPRQNTNGFGAGQVQ